jgi:DNA-binding MarR family transcriptional regulator
MVKHLIALVDHERLMAAVSRAENQAASLALEAISGRTINLAIGIVMQQNGLAPDDAEDLLRQSARTAGRGLVEVAASVVRSGALGDSAVSRGRPGPAVRGLSLVSSSPPPASLPLPKNWPNRKLLSLCGTLDRGGGDPVMSDLRHVFNDLIRFEIELWNAVDARLKREFDLPLTHFEPMSVMDRLPKCRVYDIASELGITTGGTSKLVDRIEADGYCRRLPNPEDRRSSLLELTPEGKRLFAEAGKAFDDELQRRLGTAVPERTLRQFAGTLARLRAAGRRELEQTA